MAFCSPYISYIPFISVISYLINTLYSYILIFYIPYILIFYMPYILTSFPWTFVRKHVGINRGRRPVIAAALSKYPGSRTCG
jgi:hypothetical protein